MSARISARQGQIDCTDDKIVQYLLVGLSIKETADRAKVSERTVHRRLADSDFKQKFKELRSQTIKEVANKLSYSAKQAVEVLRELVENKKKPDGVRLQASRCLLEMAIKYRSDDAFERRLEILEEHMGRRFIPQPALPAGPNLLKGYKGSSNGVSFE